MIKYLAIRWGRTEIVKILIDYHVDINTKDNDGNTALIEGNWGIVFYIFFFNCDNFSQFNYLFISKKILSSALIE